MVRNLDFAGINQLDMKVDLPGLPRFKEPPSATSFLYPVSPSLLPSTHLHLGHRATQMHSQGSVSST